MTRPRPGRRSPSPASTPPRALAILGLLLLSLFTSARASRGDVPPTLDPAGGSPPDLADPGPVPSLPEPAPDPLGPAGARLALLDVAPALGSLPARLRPAPEAPLEPAALVSTPTVSGLAWRSGTAGDPCLAQLRNRPLDVVTTYVPHESFPAMVSFTAGGYWRAKARLAPLTVVSLPLLTSSTKGQFAQCAAGAFDGSFRQIGANLKGSGARGIVVRLGWEANIGSDSHPWGVNGSAQVPAYKACWRRAAAALKAGGGPGLSVEWTNAKRPGPALSMYPGDDAVDLWGVHYYDSGPQKSTQALWDQYYDATDHGAPWGIGAWLKAARAHGKRLGVAEWGVWNQGQGAAKADDPVYMDNMYRFFRANAGSIAYETYFNAKPGVSLLCPRTAFPKAAARYRADWGR